MSGAPPDTQIVVVTYNRSGYLRDLLGSIGAMDPGPAGVVVVDNASTDDTADVIARFAAEFGPDRVAAVTMEENLGGSGGFSRGVEVALQRGAAWVWMMDDDVTVLPDALARLARWTDRYGCLHGRRVNADGTPFFWQTRFNALLGIFYPRPGDVFKRRDHFTTNCGTFEGMLIRRDVVGRIGLPDPRFFITWDDAVYGWLASGVTKVGYVNEVVLTRMRAQRSISLGVRHLNDSSDLSRYHVMRNRAYVANYLQAHGRYRPAGFAIGTALTFGKEALRALAVERRPRGLAAAVRGYRDARRIRQDPTWEPMPALDV